MAMAVVSSLGSASEACGLRLSRSNQYKRMLSEVSVLFVLRNASRYKLSSAIVGMDEVLTLFSVRR